MQPTSNKTDSAFPDQLFTQAQFKKMLGGVSDMFLHRRRKEGLVPDPIVIGNRNYWRRSDLAEFFRSLGES